MINDETVTLTRKEYNALIERNMELENKLAAIDADDGVRVPHEVALAIINGGRPIRAYREYRGLTLQELSNRTGLAISYISEIERGRKSGSVSALARIATALGTTLDVLVSE